MKKVAALFCICTLAFVGSAFALDAESGPYIVDTQGSDAFDCVGEIKLEQPPNGASLTSSQSDVCYPFESMMADDFMGDGGVMTGGGWWGGFWGGSPVTVESFNIRIYADAGGMPADPYAPPLFEENTTEYNETVGDPYGYCANFAGSFEKVQGVTYWLVVQSVFCFPPQWGWATGDGNGALAWQHFPLLGYDPWIQTAYETAWLLYNDGGGTPTEEASWSEIKSLYR